MTGSTDLELVAGLGSDDPAERDRAFTLLFERHRDRALELAWRVLGDPGLAADAVQEAFLTVHRKGARFEARARFSSWLYRVVLNECIDQRRREKRRRILRFPSPRGDGRSRGSETDAGSAPDVATPPEAGPEAAAQRAERDAAVRHAITDLSPKLARVVVLRYPEGRSYGEIGEILGVPPGTVKSRLSGAHAALRATLGVWLDGEPPGGPRHSTEP